MKKEKGFFNRLLSFAVMFLFIIGTVSAQVNQVSGVVTDESGESIIGASVIVKGTTVGTVTDLDGNYTLSIPSGGNMLVFSYVGMQTQELGITSSVINVTMRDDAQILDDVVVTGYGTTKKRDLVTSVASIGADQIKDIPVTNAAEALQGKLAGVSVTTEDGSPDASIKIRVRGGSSLTQSAEPLYIVDGFPVSSIDDIPPGDIQSMDVLKDAASTAIYGAQGANGVIIITTKDADSLSEKEGGKFNFSVDYTGYYGFKKQAKRYDMMSTEDFIRLQYENAYLTSSSGSNDAFHGKFTKYFDNAAYSSGIYDKDNASSLSSVLNYWGTQPSTDWQDETFGRTGMNLNNSLTVSGGNKKANFKLSYNRIDDKGIMYESNYVRNNISLRANIKPIKNLTISITGRYIDTEVLGAGASMDKTNEGTKTESRVRNAMAYTPIKFLSSQEEDSELIQEGSMFDPITVIDDNYKMRTDSKWGINGYVSYKFLKNFTVKSEWGYEAQKRNEDRYYGATSSYNRNGIGSFAGVILDENGNATDARYPSTVITESDNSTFRNANTLEYKKTFNSDHNLSLLAGEEIVMKKNEWTRQTTIGYQEIYPARETIDKINSLTHKYRWKTNFIDPDDNMLSFFGRADYNYQGRYYAAVTLRADASNRFNKDNRWGFFPSSALAWRLSDESWFLDAAEAARISDLKLRFSYGVAGNNNVDLGVLYNTIYEDYTIQEEEVVTIYTPTLSEVTANPNLKWETTITRNLGLDYAFFNSRLSGSIDAYLNSTKDLIIRKRTGTKYRYENMGETESKGIEVSVKGIILDKRSKQLNYGLSVDANVSFNKSKIISLGAVDQYPSSTGYLSGDYLSNSEFLFEEGQGLGRVYGYVYQGFYTADDFDSYDQTNSRWLKDGKVVNSPLAEAGTKTGGGARPGMMKLKADDNGNAVQEVIGNTMPVCTGGFSLSGNIGGSNWGNVDITANFTYSIGNDVVNLSSLDLSTVVDKTKLQNKLNTVAYGSRYSLFGADGTYIPNNYGSGSGIISGAEYQGLATTLADANQNASIYNPVSYKNALTSNAVEDGSFLRFSSLTIGYSLPDKWISKAYLTRARVFFTASNLFCWTNYSGNDPEVDVASSKNPLNSGIDWSAYPKARAFNFGLNLTF